MKQFRKMNTFYYEISLARELQFTVFKRAWRVIQSIQPWGLRDRCHSYLEKVLPSLLPLDALSGLNSNKVTVGNNIFIKDI